MPNDRRIGDETMELMDSDAVHEELTRYFDSFNIHEELTRYFDSFNMDDLDKALTEGRTKRGKHPNSQANLKKGRRFLADDFATKEASRKGHETQSLFAALQKDDIEAAYRIIESGGE